MHACRRLVFRRSCCRLGSARVSVSSRTDQLLGLRAKTGSFLSGRRIFSNIDEESNLAASKRRKIGIEVKTPQLLSSPKVVMDFRSKSIQLTEVEATLKRLLLDAASYVDDHASTESGSSANLPEKLSKAKLELRWTGGWVRDKLLGVGSHDIDVAINKMTGYQFGLKLKEYLEQPGVSEKYGLEGVAQNDTQSSKAEKSDKNKVVGGLHKIEANPEKSKHLETVTTRILGLDIDLVNLRKETYTEDSRNPQMEFGSPVEDALRRDATVNAMFYNLSTSEVEDFTGEGFNDMKKKIIRTPLEPYQTFKDDPLRVLRLIRFASRLGYTIDPAAEECMKNDDIKEALKIKISRERIGVELEKMLKGPDPRMAMGLIDRLGLYHIIFTDPTTKHDFTPRLENWHCAFEILEILSHDSANEITSHVLRDAEEKYLAWILSALVPWADAASKPPAKKGGKKPPHPAVEVAREGFKAPNKVCDIVVAAVRNMNDIKKLVQQASSIKLQNGLDGAPKRDTYGMAIRQWGVSWRSQLIFALMHEILDHPQQEKDILRNYARFLQKVSSLDLLEAYAFKPLIDGKALAKALGTPPGPWMKDALEVVMAWQLRNPDDTDPEKAIEEVRSQSKTKDGGELTTCLIEYFLRLTIRPLFAKAPSTVTPAGRKKLHPQPRPIESVDDEEQKPWKYRDRYCLELLRWVLRRVDKAAVEQKWHLLTPPVLTILDDPDPLMKALGCEFISLLSTNTTPSLLARTGLGDVIEQALMPCLTYLPSLTTEADSITLLNTAFPALITLSHIRFPPIPSQSTTLSTQHQRTKFLDQVLRRGVISGYTYAGEYVKITIVLLTHLTSLANELKIDFVRHLKDVLPLLTRVLGDPFAPASPELLLAAARAEQAAVLNAWPRIALHRGEVMAAVARCWGNLMDSGEDLEEVERELRETVEMLVVAVGDEVDIKREFGELAVADERLEDLFKGLI